MGNKYLDKILTDPILLTDAITESAVMPKAVIKRERLKRENGSFEGYTASVQDCRPHHLRSLIQLRKRDIF